MPIYFSSTRFYYTHPDSGRYIGKDPVMLEQDAWLDAQVAAGVLIQAPSEGEKAAPQPKRSNTKV